MHHTHHAQETRDDDRLPEEVSPLLDDSTIGAKNAAAFATAAASRKQVRQAKQAAHGEGRVHCCRRPATRNLLLAGVMLVAIALLAIEVRACKRGQAHPCYVLRASLGTPTNTTSLPREQLGPDATQEVLGRNVTFPDVHLPDVHMPKIDWSRVPPFLRPKAEPLLYNPEVYPWAT